MRKKISKQRLERPLKACGAAWVAKSNETGSCSVFSRAVVHYLQTVVYFQKKEYRECNPHWKKVVELMKKQDKEFARCFNGMRRAKGGKELLAAWNEAESCGFVAKK